MCEICSWVSAHTVGGTDAIAVMALPSGVAVIAPREHMRLAAASPQVQTQLLTMANDASIVLYESLQAHGTNIIVEDREHAYVLVVPRFENDEVGYTWEGKRASPSELQNTAKKLGEDTWTIGKRDMNERTIPVVEEKAPERIVEAQPIKKPAVEEELARPDMQPPGSGEGHDLGDIASDIQKNVTRGPTQEKDYRIRHLTRRR